MKTNKKKSNLVPVIGIILAVFMTFLRVFAVMVSAHPGNEIIPALSSILIYLAVFTVCVITLIKRNRKTVTVSEKHTDCDREAGGKIQ